MQRSKMARVAAVVVALTACSEGNGEPPECVLAGFVWSDGYQFRSPRPLGEHHIRFGQPDPRLPGFTVTSTDAKWVRGAGSFGSGYGTSGWDGTVTVTVGGPGTVKPRVTLTGAVDSKSNCSKIYWKNKSVWCKGVEPGIDTCGGTGPNPPSPPTPPTPPLTGIEKVHIVWMNHLVRSSRTPCRVRIAAHAPLRSLV